MTARADEVVRGVVTSKPFIIALAVGASGGAAIYSGTAFYQSVAYTTGSDVLAYGVVPAIESTAAAYTVGTALSRIYNTLAYTAETGLWAFNFLKTSFKLFGPKQRV